MCSVPYVGLIAIKLRWDMGPLVATRLLRLLLLLDGAHTGARAFTMVYCYLLSRCRPLGSMVVAHQVQIKPCWLLKKGAQVHVAGIGVSREKKPVNHAASSCVDLIHRVTALRI